MRTLCAALLFVAAAASAQTEPAPPPPDKPATGERKSEQKPEPRPGTPVEGVFRPSEEVSADKEVDFPADL